MYFQNLFFQMNWPAENKCTQDIPRGLMPTATVIVSDMQVATLNKISINIYKSCLVLFKTSERNI